MWSHLSSHLLIQGLYHLVNIWVICLPSSLLSSFFPPFLPSIHLFFFLSFFSCLFRDGVYSLSSKFIKWLKITLNPNTPTSGSWVLVLQTCATTPGSCGTRHHHKASCLPASHSSKPWCHTPAQSGSILQREVELSLWFGNFSLWHLL